MQVKINKNSPYAPIRYEATRPYAVTLGKAFLAAAKKGEQHRMAFVQGPLLPLLRSAVSKIGKENGPGPVQAEMVNVQIFGGYLGHGKIIFDFAGSLTKSLSITDALDIPCGELPFPADSFYLHFGADAGLSDWGTAIEGAYVSRLPDRMLVDLVPQGMGDRHFLGLHAGESTIGAPVMLDDPTKTVAQSLEDSVAHVLAENAKVYAQIAEVEAQLIREYGEIVKVPSPVADLEHKGPLLQKALSLIVNAMFYLAAEPDDIIEDWGQGTPQVAIEKLAMATKPGEVRTLENTLRNAGYSKVRLVGRKFAQSVVAQQIQAASAGGKTLSAHFRRGHFRRQAYGPQSSLRKTIFVAPVMVNAALGGEPQGRIYEVVPRA